LFEVAGMDKESLKEILNKQLINCQLKQKLLKNESQRIKTKSIEELRKLAEDLRKKITEMMIDKSLKKLSKPHLLKMTKKDLARVLTVIREKERKNA
jgi:large subunit ribosomal protein L29